MTRSSMKQRFGSWAAEGRPFWLLGIIFSAGLGAVVLLPFVEGENTVLADAGDMQAARETFPHIVGTRLDSCNLCHTGTKWALNDYGRDYKQQGRDLVAINTWDSDNDGFDNIEEIEALSFPGDASDVPPPAPTPSPEPTVSPEPPPVVETDRVYLPVILGD